MNKIELRILSIRANYKKVSKRQAIEMYGEEKVTRRLNEALEFYYEDSLQLVNWMDANGNHIKTIRLRRIHHEY